MILSKPLNIDIYLMRKIRIKLNKSSLESPNEILLCKIRHRHIKHLFTGACL